MRVLGVDPGTRCTGWGLVERNGSRLAGVEAGVVRTDAKASLETRLRTVYDGLVEVLGRLAPDAVAVEDVFYAKHASAAIKLGHVRGVTLLAAANAELEVFSYPPALVKRTVAGRGRADKEQLGRLVVTVLGWREVPAADATDALAVAITHAQASRLPAPPAPARRRRRR